MNAIRPLRMTVVAAFLAATLPAFGESGTLVVTLGGFKSDKGKAMVSLYNAKESFTKMENARFRAMVPVSGGKAQVEIADLEPGTYSVSVFHDENGNGKLDTNFLGIPKEVVRILQRRPRQGGAARMGSHDLRLRGRHQNDLHQRSNKPARIPESNRPRESGPCRP